MCLAGSNLEQLDGRAAVLPTVTQHNRSRLTPGSDLFRAPLFFLVLDVLLAVGIFVLVHFTTGH